ncbi:MAG: helix-turn-helix domain-containing protein [Bacilli bacterium]
MISDKIKKLRKDFNISQVELANALGVTKQCVSNWENDNILPSIFMLIKIAKYFNVSTDYLLDIDNSKTLNVSGLSDTEIAHLKMIIQDLKNKQK